MSPDEIVNADDGENVILIAGRPQTEMARSGSTPMKLNI